MCAMFCKYCANPFKIGARQLGRDSRITEATRLQSELPALQHRLAAAEQALAQRRKKLTALERAAFGRSQELRLAERNLDAAAAFERAAAQIDQAQHAIEQRDSGLKTLAAELDVHRSAVANLISELSDCFDAIFRQIIPLDT